MPPPGEPYTFDGVKKNDIPACGLVCPDTECLDRINSIRANELGPLIEDLLQAGYTLHDLFAGVMEYEKVAGSKVLVNVPPAVNADDASLEDLVAAPT
jgi:hypothetical protein